MKPMNCPGHMLLFGCAAAQLPRPAVAVRRVVDAPPRRAGRRAARPAARAARSRRTTRTSSARRSRSRTRCSAASTSATIYDLLRAGGRGRALDAAREASSAPTRSGTSPRRARAGARAARARVHGERGRRRVLRPEDRPAHARLARPLVADRDDPARLPDAAALRPPLHGRRQRRAHAGDDPPRADRLVRALHRHPDRALRAARSRSGSRRCSCAILPVGEAHRERGARAGGAARAAYRVEVDESDETVGKKIRNAEVEKIPFVIVYGDKESDEVARGARARRRAVDRVARGLLARLACYADALTSRGETVSHLQTARAALEDCHASSTELEVGGVNAAACQRLFHFRRRTTRAW